MSKKLKIEKSQKKQKLNILRHTEELLDTGMATGAHTEIFGNNQISIDGCMGVHEYRDTYLKLKLQRGSIILCGTGFDITYFENRLITVKGKISSVEFCG